MVIRGEQGTQGAVDQTGDENLTVVGAAFALHEAAGIASARSVLLFVLHLERHEIGVGFCVLGGYYRGQEHRIALLDHHRAVGLLGQFARFDLDLASVGQRNDLADCIVQLFVFHKKI